VGSLSGASDAFESPQAFGAFAPGELGVEPLFFEEVFYSTVSGGMATEKTAQGDASTRVSLSGSKVRELLARGEPLPAEFTRPEVAAILSEWARKSPR
jgi:ATP sulfurylase